MFFWSLVVFLSLFLFVSHSAFPLKCSIIRTPYLPFLTFALAVLKAKSQDNNRHINKLDLSPAVLLYHLHHTAWKCVCSSVRDPYCSGLSRRREKIEFSFFLILCLFRLVLLFGIFPVEFQIRSITPDFNFQLHSKSLISRLRCIWLEMELISAGNGTELPCSNAAFKERQNDRIYEMRTHECHSAVVITGRKLWIYFEPWLSQLPVEVKKTHTNFFCQNIS